MKNKKIKNLLITAMAVMMIVGVTPFTIVAQADENVNAETFDLTKAYSLINPDTDSPAEIFKFNVEKVGVEDSSKTLETMPNFSEAVYNVEFNYGEASAEGAKKQNNITLPDFDAVGIYTYRITEQKGNTAGVSYSDKAMLLKVYVTNSPTEKGEFNKTCVLQLEDGTKEKIDSVENEYYAGTLTIKKEVKGIFGDTKKNFKVDVTFNVPEGKNVKSVISYSDNDEIKTITPELLTDGSETVTIDLKDDEAVSFKNIPYGVKYSVVEHDYSKDKYEQSYNFDDGNKLVDSAEEKVTVINSKGGTIDTGVLHDTTMYVVVIILIAALSVIVKRRKRNN